jgi:hypothetical protein
MVFGFTACTSTTLVQDWKDPAVKLEKRLKAVQEAAKTNPL